MLPRLRRSSHWALLLGLSLLFGGCDASLDPFGDETGFYSIYGHLAVSGEPNFIRVKDLTVPPVQDSTRTLDVAVRLKNLETGKTEALTDSVVQFDGAYVHNFRADLDIRPNTTYRITVEGPKGRSARARATTPRVTVANVTPKRGAECQVAMGFSFPQISKGHLVDASLGLKYGGAVRFVDVRLTGGTGPGIFFGFKPAVLVEEVVPAAIIPLTRCRPSRYCRLLDDRTVRIAYTHFGPDRRPDSTRTDPLASDVKNGLGTLVGLRRDTLIATLDTNLRCPGSETPPCRPGVTVPERRCPDVGDLQ